LHTSLRRGLILVVAILIVLFGATSGSSQPIVRVGDTWTYEGIAHLNNKDVTFVETRRVLSVDYVEGKRSYLIKATSTWQEEGTVKLRYTDEWSLAGRDVVKGVPPSQYIESFVYQPALKMYSFPLTTGKEWWTSSNTSYTWSDPSNPNRTRIGRDQQTFLIKVTGEKDVQTSLGTFKAYVIEYRYRPAVPGAGTYLWYQYKFVESLGANVEEITYDPQGGISKVLKLVSFSSETYTTSLATSSVVQTQTTARTPSAISTTTKTPFTTDFLYSLILVLVVFLVLCVILLTLLARKKF